MYYQGIGRVFWGYFNFWDSLPLTAPISTLAGTYPSLERYLALILCKKARPVQFCALAEFPRELVYFQGIGRVFWGYFNFWDSLPLTAPISTLAGTYPSLERYLALILCKKETTSPFWCSS